MFFSKTREALMRLIDINDRLGSIGNKYPSLNRVYNPSGLPSSNMPLL